MLPSILFMLVKVIVASAYVLHSSCNDVQNDLERNIQKAFSYTDDVSAQLFLIPIDPDVKRLAELVYGKHWSSVPETISKLQPLRTSRQYDEFMKNQETWASEVVIFCDVNHLKQTTYVDHKTKNEVKGYTDAWYFYPEGDQLFKACNTSTPPRGPEVTIGYNTIQDAIYTERKGEMHILDGNFQITKPHVLHLCKWYLKRPNQFLDPTDAAGKASRAVIDPAKYTANKTQVDILSGFSQFLLRQFSHTRSISRGEASEKKESTKMGWLEVVQNQRLDNTYNLGYMGIGIETLVKPGFNIIADGKVVSKSPKVQASGTAQPTGIVLATGLSQLNPRWQRTWHK